MAYVRHLYAGYIYFVHGGDGCRGRPKGISTCTGQKMGLHPLFPHTDPESILPEDWQTRPIKQIVSRFMSVGYLHAKKRTTNSNCPDHCFGSSLKKSRILSLCTMEHRCVVRTTLPPAIQKIMTASGQHKNGGETGIAFDQKISKAEYSFN